MDAARRAGVAESALAIMQDELVVLRAEAQQAKPIAAQLKGAERRHADAMAKYAAHRARAEEQAAHLEKLRNEIAEHKDAEAKVQERVDVAHAELEVLRRQVLLGSSAGAPDARGDPLAAMPASWRAVIEASSEKDTLIAEFVKTLPSGDGGAAPQPAQRSPAPSGIMAEDVDVVFMQDLLMGGADGQEGDANFVREFKERMAKRTPDQIQAAVVAAAKRRKSG